MNYADRIDAAVLRLEDIILEAEAAGFVVSLNQKQVDYSSKTGRGVLTMHTIEVYKRVL